MLVKTHLIVTDQWDEYEVKWHKNLIDIDMVPSKKFLPIFIIISGSARRELSTLDFNLVAATAKKMCYPRGRGAITIDRARIYVKATNGEVHIGTVSKTHIRKYAPMYDEC